MPGAFSLLPPADFDLKRDVCSYGYFVLAPNLWDVTRRVLRRPLVLGGQAVAVEISQPKGAGTPLRVQTARALAARSRAEARLQITRMLRLDESDAEIASFHAVDPRWTSSGRGRLFRSPSFFEDVIKTVTSCNVTWPGTVSMNRRLCEVYGLREKPPAARPSRPAGASPVARRSRAADAHAPLSAFPMPATLSRVRAASLRGRCRVGYRDQRIVDLARLLRLPRTIAWFEDATRPDDEIHAALLELPGVGPYAAANIMQLLGRYARLPLDTESVRHGKLVLGFRGSSAQIMKKVKAHFAPFGRHAFRSYWFELWSFYESKRGPAWTWERDRVADTFTAAQLD